jgi:uncharacterized protein involved in outer membrane biogenesis
MKLIKRLILAVLVLIIVALIGLYVSLNSVIKNVVQRQATASLDVPTTLDSAHFAPFAGELSLSGLDVGSPQGFSAPHMFTLNGLTVAVTYGQLFGNPIHINKIEIDNPELVVEQSGLKLNIQALMGQTSQAPTTGSGAPAQPIKLIIDELDLNNSKVTFLPGLPGVTNQMSTDVPSVTLKNIGNADSGQNGAAIKDVIMQAATALAGKAGAGSGLPPELSKALSTNLADVAQQLGGSFNTQFQNAAGSLTQNLSKNLSGAANNAIGNVGKNLPSSVNNLLGGNQNNTKPGQ